MQLVFDMLTTGTHRRPPPGPDRAWVRVQQKHAEVAAMDEDFGEPSEHHALPWRHREQRHHSVGFGVLLQGSPG